MALQWQKPTCLPPLFHNKRILTSRLFSLQGQPNISENQFLQQPQTPRLQHPSKYYDQSPTLGAHTHAHPCPWVLGGHGYHIVGNIIGDVTIFEYMGAIWMTWVGMGAILLFMDGHGCDIIGNIFGHVTNFEYMGAIWIAWVGIGCCWWVWYGYGYKFEGNVGL